jgi:TRAP-type mannitol/chloroaromatic compound transport system permease large subunit
MRQKNWRLIIVGVVLIVSAAGFFIFMGTMAPRSNDPAALMQTVGQVCGAVGAIALLMLIFGAIGKKA